MTPLAWKSWTLGLAPVLSLPALEALRRALYLDDRRLQQGETVQINYAQAKEADQPWDDCLPMAACPLALAGWLAGEQRTRGECEREFHRLSKECQERTGDELALIHFTGWVDDCSRITLRSELLTAVDWALFHRRRALEEAVAKAEEVA
jgi:hypothetical protein